MSSGTVTVYLNRDGKGLSQTFGSGNNVLSSGLRHNVGSIKISPFIEVIISYLGAQGQVAKREPYVNNTDQVKIINRTSKSATNVEVQQLAPPQVEAFSFGGMQIDWMNLILCILIILVIVYFVRRMNYY